MTGTVSSVFNSLLKFINYWYFRYIMVTELYILESWERVAIHCFLFAVFLVQWVFNYTVILPITAKIIGFDIGIDPSLRHGQLSN